MNKIINWGVIGIGKVCELKSVPAYQKTNGFCVKAVMGREILKAENFAKRHHIELFFDDAHALIHHPEIDAIYIATPPDSHLFYAQLVADAGKICCVEKPMAVNYKEAIKMNALFAVKNIPLFVSYYRRSLPRFEQVKKWLDEAAIGTIRQVTWQLSKTSNPVTDVKGAVNWRTDKNSAPGGYFDDLASHGLNLFQYLLGDIVTVKGIAVNQQGNYTAKDAISATWKHRNDVLGSGTWNFGAWKREDKVEIIGEKGKISFSMFNEEALKLETLEGVKEVFINNPQNIQLFHTQNMQKQLSENNFIHPSMGDSALKTAWVMETILTD